MTDETIVIFRKWRDGGIIALFPEIPADYQGRYCQSYETVGQHGGADYHGVVRDTRPATAEEYADLLEELTGIGYKCIIRKRLSPAMRREYDAELRRYA